MDMASIGTLVAIAIGIGICAAGGLFAARVGSRQEDED